MKFEVGYHDLHPDLSLNFQLNRWITYLGPDVVPELASLACRVDGYDDWIRDFLALSEVAEQEGRTLAAGLYTRSAEFFMTTADPRKAPARRRFLRLIREGYAIPEDARVDVRYEQGYLPTYRFTPTSPRSTMVVFGGFDSYIEEFLPILLAMSDAGYDVVAFEGPGQGAALEDAHLPMTVEWHLPVAAVLDHFQLTDVTLVGVSLGGALAVRAAAREPRVRRVVAFDVLYDFLDVSLRQAPAPARPLVRGLVRIHADQVLEALLARSARRRLVTDWGLQQGMHVFGERTRAGFLHAAARFTTRDVSSQITQDVLLLAGVEDHYVPRRHLSQQLDALTNARSVTARVFTRAESAQNHCQVGNLGLALDVITNWIERTRSD